MDLDSSISIETFNAINLLDIDLIKKLTKNQLIPILPCLTRMTFCPSLDKSEEWNQKKKQIHQLLNEMEEVNTIVSLLSIDFQSLDNEIKKLKQKQIEPSLNLCLDFESASPTTKLMLFFSEYYNVQNQTNELTYNKPQSLTKFVQSELFDHDLYVDIISVIICIVLAELPNTLPLIELIETLTTIKIGAKIICRIAANFTESFNNICSSLLELSDKENEDNFIGLNRVKIIRMLCKMNPSYSLVIRSAAIENCKLPGLCVYLTLDHINNTIEVENQIDNPNNSNCQTENLDYLNDLVSFLKSILLGYDEKTRNWFAAYLKNGQKKIDCGNMIPAISLLRQQLLKYLNYLYKLCQENLDNDQTKLIIQCTALLKLYCALKGVASLKFNKEEVVGLLNLITIKTPSTSVGIRFASIGICIFLASPLLTSNADGERKIIEWLQWIVKKESLFGQVSGVRSSFGEMLLLIAIHFHSNQVNAISELVNKFLGIKLPIKQYTLSKIKQIFTQEIFTEQVVTTHAIKVPVTKNLNSSIVGFLPVHCIFQLLKSRAFTKYKVPIKNWIFKQICNSTAPLNTVWPSLIEIYVNSVIVPPSIKTTATGYTNEPISEEELNSIFNYRIYSLEDENNCTQMIIDEEKRPTCILTTQILLTYYVLLYDDVRLTQIKNMPSEKQIEKYSARLMSKIPLFYLLQEAKSNEDQYGCIFPSLLRLIATHYSHLCLVPDWFSTEKKYHSNFSKKSFNIQTEIENEKRRLINAINSLENSDKDVNNFIRTFDRLLELPRKAIWPLAEVFIYRLSVFLSPDLDKQVMFRMKEFWWKLNSLQPDYLRVMTINSLSQTKFKLEKLNWEDIVKDPLLVLKCDEKVFICPELMEIILHILQSFLIASRTYFAHHLLELPSKSMEEDKDREELRIALIQTQESCAIQILLEACNERPEIINDEKLYAKLKEVQKLICTHLHQVFISDPTLAKLIHFQGYDSSLLNLVVTKIPSMHICLDFIPELLGQPDINKQVCILIAMFYKFF